MRRAIFGASVSSPSSSSASASSGSERRLSRAEAGWPRVGSMHVERTRAAVGESAGGVVDLRAGHANVRDYRVSALDAGLGEDGREGGEVGLKEVEVAADGFEFARAAVRFEGSKSMPMSRPPGVIRRSNSAEWPPRPTVQLQSPVPAVGSGHGTGSSRTGMWREVNNRLLRLV